MGKDDVVRPEAVFQELKSQWQAKAELAEHKWTVDQVNELQQRAQDDNEAAQRYKALLPYINNSNARGDFKTLKQLTRDEARQALGGEPWSHAEIKAITDNPELYKRYADELTAARREGRIIQSNDHAHPHHFAGEDETAFDRNLDRKLRAVDSRNEAKRVIQETKHELEKDPGERLGQGAVVSYLKTQLDAVWNHQNKLYPVHQLDGYNELVEAFEQAGGDPVHYRFYPKLNN